MHSRNEILLNQKQFKSEIMNWLKKDFLKSKEDLNRIETRDQEIIKEKEILEKKFEKIKVEKELKKVFINETNIYPKFYAWWDKELEKAEIFLYETK